MAIPLRNSKKEDHNGDRAYHFEAQTIDRPISVEEYITGAERTIPNPAAMTVAERLQARAEGKKAPAGITLWLTERQKHLLDAAFERSSIRSKQELVRSILMIALEDQYGKHVSIDPPRR